MIDSLSNEELLAAIRALVKKSGCIEADLLVHLGEFDERKLFLAQSFSSMFSYCVDEPGFSEDATYNRIFVARAGRRLPALIEVVRSGTIHLAGVRLLVPHLTEENHGDLLARAAGKSKRKIEEMIVMLFPKPPVTATIRKFPRRSALAASLPPEGALCVPTELELSGPAAHTAPPPPPPSRVQHRPAIEPLAEDAYKIQFTASRAFREKLKQTQDLLRHRVPDGDLAAIFETALDLLIQKVKKERFAVCRKARPAPPTNPIAPEVEGHRATRHIPDSIKRIVYERDGGRCTFADEGGRRCSETGTLEFDHLDGFARRQVHSVERIRLLCRPHNQYTAEQLYGRTFMQRARLSIPVTARLDGTSDSTCPGTSPQSRLL